MIGRFWRSRKATLAAHLKIMLDAGWLTGTTAVTSGLGFVYWWVAAHWFPAASVGLASAAISAMTLLGTAGMLGLGTLLMGELARHRRHAPSLVTTASLLAGAASALLGGLFAFVAPEISADLRPLAASPDHVILFALGTSLTGMVLVLDQASLGVMRAPLQFWRNVVFAAGKLAALFVVALWLASRTGLTIYATWLIGNAVSLIAVVGVEALQGKLSHAYRPRLDLLSGMTGAALSHHALNLLLIGPGLLLPIVVTSTLSATANAYFYSAWMMVGFVNVIPVTLSMVLYASAAADPSQLQPKLRFTLGLAAVAGLAANVFMLLFGHSLLHLFGANYANQAAGALYVLSLGVFPVVVIDHYVAICRALGEPMQAVRPLAAGGFVTVLLAAIGGHVGGLVGLSAGVLAAQTLVALFLAPTIWRTSTGSQGALVLTSVRDERDVS